MGREFSSKTNRDKWRFAASGRAKDRIEDYREELDCASRVADFRHIFKQDSFQELGVACQG